MPFRGLTMLKSPKLIIKGGLCYGFAMVLQGVREKARVFETLNFFGKGLTQIETDVQLL